MSLDAGRMTACATKKLECSGQRYELIERFPPAIVKAHRFVLFGCRLVAMQRYRRVFRSTSLSFEHDDRREIQLFAGPCSTGPDRRPVAGTER
jgi:hypothetical protein